MNPYTWTQDFRRIYDSGAAAYKAGRRSPGGMFDERQRAELATIGCSAQELFDFVEDFIRYGEPDYETALLVTAVRRDYFLTVQGGVASTRLVDMSTLPPKPASVAGISWLPRAIAKAKAKLRGEMPAELMFTCGGDREFFERVKIHPADFLRVVWSAGEDDDRVVRYVVEAMKR